jgi:hypothetical protein
MLITQYDKMPNNNIAVGLQSEKRKAEDNFVKALEGLAAFAKANGDPESGKQYLRIAISVFEDGKRFQDGIKFAKKHEDHESEGRLFALYAADSSKKLQDGLVNKFELRAELAEKQGFTEEAERCRVAAMFVPEAMGHLGDAITLAQKYGYTDKMLSLMKREIDESIEQ